MAERPRSCQCKAVLSFKYLANDSVLALEMAVQRTLCHSGSGCDIVHAYSCVSLGAKEQVRGVQDTSASWLS